MKMKILSIRKAGLALLRLQYLANCFYSCRVNVSNAKESKENEHFDFHEENIDPHAK